VTTRTDEDAAKLIRDLKPHIAVDLKGHTTDAYPASRRSARRPSRQLSRLPGNAGRGFH
jgi:hypothetical protein